MINPVYVAAASSLASLGGTVGSTFSNLFGLGRLQKLAQYDGNIFSPLTSPTESLIFAALQRGYLTPDQAHLGFLLLGIPFGRRFTDFYENNIAQLWSGVSKLNIPFYDIATAFAMYNKGIIDGETLRDIRKRTGETEVSFKPFLDYQKQTYTLEQALTLWNRGEIEEAEAKKKIKLYGGYSDEEISKLSELRNVIPPVSDLVRFSIREVFNEQLAKRLGYTEEYEEQKDFQYWANRLGLGKMEAKLQGEGAKEINWPLAYWIAHWQIISPTQGYEMLHRLRKDRIDRFKKDFPEVEEFTIDNLRDVLKASDYPKPFRDRLAAISSHMLGRIDIRRGYRIGAISENELKEQYKDLGFVDDDVNVLAEIAKKDKEQYDKAEKKKKLGTEINRSATAILSAYETGSITEGDAFVGLMAVWDEEDKTKLAINTVKLKQKTAYVKEFAKSVKREFFAGFYDSSTALAELIGAGMRPDEATRRVSIWIRQLSYPQKIASTTKILDWYKRGLITIEDANFRLENLGWSNADILIHLESAVQDIAIAEAKKEEQRARTEKQEAAASEKIVKAAAKQQKDQRADLRRQYPIAMIKRWFKLGLISEESARSFLELHFDAEDAINTVILEWYIEIERENTNGKS